MVHITPSWSERGTCRKNSQGGHQIRSFRQNSIQVGIRFGFNDRVAFAGFSFQTAAIKNGDDSSTVTNQLGRLQRAGSLTYAFAPHAQHGGQKFLSERKFLGSKTIFCHQEPSRKASVNEVETVARR